MRDHLTKSSTERDKGFPTLSVEVQTDIIFSVHNLEKAIGTSLLARRCGRSPRLLIAWTASLDVEREENMKVSRTGRRRQWLSRVIVEMVIRPALGGELRRDPRELAYKPNRACC